jgi:hypothetical protein
MSKIAAGAVPNLRPGQRLRAGDIAGVSGFVPQELQGASSFGNRQVVNKQKRTIGGGGAGLTIDTVEALPAIPTTGGRMVFWTSAGAGDGDNQIWVAYAGQTDWTPLQALTSLDGTP